MNLRSERLPEPLEKDGREALQSQRKADGLDFFFPVGPVHGRNPRRDMPLIVDILRIMGLFRGKDFLFEDREEIEDGFQGPPVILALQRPFERAEVQGVEEIGLFQIS